MILLTRVQLTNQPTDPPSQRVGEDIIAIDAWSIITVEKYHYNGGSEGSTLHLADGLAPVIVTELMTDVVHMVELEVHRGDDAD